MGDYECEDCGESFDTLSSKRLHECPAAETERSDPDHIRHKEFGFTQPGGFPFVAFEVSLEGDPETSGTFDLAFAARTDEEGDLKFAFVGGDGTAIEYLEYDEDLAEWLDAVLEHNGYTTCVNYTDALFEDDLGRPGFAVMGRRLGLAYDWVEREQPLPDDFYETIPEIQAALSAVTDDAR